MDINLTGSSGSLVGPAVTRNFIPDKIFRAWKFSNCSIICSVDDILPYPMSPHACFPYSGPIILILFISNFSTLDCVNLFVHMSGFMAGTINNFLLKARQTVVNKSSPTPLAILFIKFAVQGAITRISAHFAKSKCSKFDILDLPFS